MAHFLQRGKWMDRSRRCPHYVTLQRSPRERGVIWTWAVSDDVAGEFYISELVSREPGVPHRMKVRFSDPDSAFACKMRWG